MFYFLVSFFFKRQYMAFELDSCRGNSITNPNKGKWYKFNDTIVEEFDMNDASVEAECFGGTYKAKVTETTCKFYNCFNYIQEEMVI